MYSTEQIIEKLRKGIQICYEQNKNRVTKENMRLALSIEKQFIGSSTRVDLIDASANTKLGQIKIPELFGINLAEGFAVNTWLKNKLEGFSQKELIPENEISAHIYTVADDFAPSARICRSGQTKRELTIQELTN